MEEWGTGKTTLIESVQKILNEEYKDNVVTVWFGYA